MALPLSPSEPGSALPVRRPAPIPLALRLRAYDRLEVREHRVTLPGLERPLRLVHLTDFHCEPGFPAERVEEVVRRANALDPDVIALTGDYATRGAGFAPQCARALGGLRARHGCFAVLGNHDIVEGPVEVERALAGQGIRVVTNQAVAAPGALWIVGADDCWIGEPDLDRPLRQVPAGGVPVVLTHSANLFAAGMPRRLVALCGDTHGGQVYFPWLTRRALPGGRTFLRGWYRRGPGLIYVSRGIGTMKIPLRLFARPEITLFHLEPGPTLSAEFLRSYRAW